MEMLLQRYELYEELGSGGTAVVVRAHDTVLGRPCAVKLMRELGEGEAAQRRRRRLQVEAKALALVAHRHVVRVFDVGQAEGRDFLVMELIEGGSLADRVLAEGPLRPAEAIELVTQVLSALSVCHLAGIVHRDVKPDNLLLRGPSEVVLCDFGIARQDLAALTRTGVALGSVGYMAPEQRVDARRVLPAADLYGVGCTLFNLLTGDTPVDLYLAPAHSPRWEGVPRALRGLIRKATHVSPEQRFQSAEEMALALREVAPAVAECPPHQLVSSATPAHPITRVDVVAPASRDEVEVWAGLSSRPPGGLALRVGVVVLATVVGVTLVASGALESSLTALSPPAHERPPVALPPVQLEGVWRGTFGEHTGTLTLRRAQEGVVGELVLQLGRHTLKAQLTGSWDEDERTLVLEEATSHTTYQGLIGANLILTGVMARPGAPQLPFALVRIE